MVWFEGFNAFIGNVHTQQGQEFTTEAASGRNVVRESGLGECPSSTRFPSKTLRIHPIWRLKTPQKWETVGCRSWIELELNLSVVFLKESTKLIAVDLFPFHIKFV